MHFCTDDTNSHEKAIILTEQYLKQGKSVADPVGLVGVENRRVDRGVDVDYFL